MWEAAARLRLIPPIGQIVPPDTLSSGLTLFYRSIKCEQATARCTLITSASVRTRFSLYRYSGRRVRAVNENAFEDRKPAASVRRTLDPPPPPPPRRSRFLAGGGFPDSAPNCIVRLTLSRKLNAPPPPRAKRRREAGGVHVHAEETRKLGLFC